MKDFVTECLKLKDFYPERAEALAKEHKIDIEDLELVRKGLVAEAPEVNRDERAVISFINMETVDRDNEIIDPEGAVLTYFRKNPVVPYGHDYRGLPMAKNMWIKKTTNKKGKKGLLAKTVFLKRPSINEELYHLYSDDVAGTGPALKGWSIGFIPLKWEFLEKKSDVDETEHDTRPRKKYTKWELLEYSGVMLPSCREALTEMVAKGLIKSEKLKKDIIEIELEEMDNDYDDTVYDSGDLVTKPEETDNFIRIPVRDCKVTATITISEKQGITALYCGKIKKIRTYIFDKRPPFSWTMKRALAWVKEHGKALQNLIDRYMDGGETGKNLDVIELDIIKEMFDEGSEGKAKYNCECIKCGHKLTSDKHCKELKCPKCGGQMRRVERPGPGQESTDNRDSFDFLEDEREDIYSTGNEEVIKLKETTIKGLNKLKEKGYISPQQFEDTILGTIKIDEYDTGTTKIRIRERDLYFNEDGLLDGTGSGCDEGGNREVIELEEENLKGVIPFKETSKAPEGEKWDGPKEIREAEVSDLKIMCCWFDSENPDIKGSYKLPHHKAKGHAVVWRGVAAAMVALLGGRGGVNIPDSDKKGVYSHLAKTYKQFDKEPPEFREYTEEELKEVFPEVYEEPKQTEREQQITRELFDRLTEQLNKVEEELKALKEGRVLSAKNRKLVKQCADMLNELYEATEPPQREEFELEIENERKVDNQDMKGDGKGDKVDIDKEALTLKIASILKNKIEGMVQSAINRERGKVE